jgi:glycosyltransferase involved in cell wall biosynthesis
MDSVAQAAAWRRELAADDPRIVIDGQHVSRRDLSRYYAAAHVVAMPSRCEGFGLVGLEALAHGRTVIASDWSGPGDYLAAEDCIVVPAERPVAAYGYPGLAREIELAVLVEAMRVAAGNPDRVVRLGEVARVRVLRDWTWVGKCQTYLAERQLGGRK